MLKKIVNPLESQYKKLCKRPVLNINHLESTVQHIFDSVEKDGDKAIQAFTLQFDNKEVKEILINPNDYKMDFNNIPTTLKEAINIAFTNITNFHKAQIQSDVWVETMTGVVCMQKSVGIERVGLYIPGGSASLFSSVLMLAIPAKLAGCKEMILCTPPDENGKINPLVVYCAQLCGVDSIYAVGGAQAVAMMTLGTETVKSVHKIFGPGNQYVTAAKQIAMRYGVSVDMPAGPSEVLVFADETAIPAFVASDLLAQAEHGADSQVVLVCQNEQMANDVILAVKMQSELLPRKDVIGQSLLNSKIIIIPEVERAFHFINEYAPEHLIIASDRADEYITLITNAGSVFLGNFTPESAGDYASGTNHTLPTNGWAKSFSGLNIDAFTKKITYQSISENGLKKLGNTVIHMAEAESLQAHANAVKLRLNQLEN